MNTDIFDYQLLTPNDLDDKNMCHRRFSFDVVNINNQSTINYLADFHCIESNRHLYYCDYFPAMWKKHADKLNKLLCHETDVRVNFRKITLTCFYIFHEQIAANDDQAVFVISGSLIKNEQLLPEIDISRKLKLYWQILNPHAFELKYRLVKILNYNAIAFTKESNSITDEDIQQGYANFKNRA